MKLFKIRCSAIHQIMAKATAGRTIPVGAETYVQNWRKTQLYGKDANFNTTSKYTDKGIFMEPEAINYLNENYSLPYMEKNTEPLENDFITGLPDITLPSISTVVDIKCSWDCFTFPLDETELTKEYWWQVQGYMDLLGYKKAQVVYVLMTAPDHIIEREAQKLANKEQSELTAEIYERTKEQMNYDKFPTKLRVKAFEVEYDPEAAQAIRQRVTDCRTYLKSLGA